MASHTGNDASTAGERPTRPSPAPTGVEVVCLGETMLMFAPPPHETLEYALEYRVFNGGAESNVAIGLQRLGVDAAWVGKLPDNALGRKVVNEIRSFGVNCNGVVWSDRGRVGTFFFEWGAPPRPMLTIYDRQDSAATTLRADELDWEAIGAARWLHLTGITPATSETCRQMTIEVARRARQAGLRVSFDVNYRSLLWSPERARQVCAELLPHVNLLVATEADMAMLLGETLRCEEALRQLYARGTFDAAVMTCGSDGSLGIDEAGLCRSPGYRLQLVNRLGAGDAFMAGLLYGYGCTGQSLQAGLDWGGAMAALKMTVPQNIPLIHRGDVERLLAGRNPDLVR